MPDITTPHVDPGDTGFATWAQAVRADLLALADEVEFAFLMSFVGD